MDGQTNIEYIIINYLNGTITTGERQQLTAWLQQSSENQLVFDQMREIWLASKSAGNEFKFDFRAAFEQFKKKTGQEKTTPNPGIGRAITISRYWAAAVVLLAVVGGAALCHFIQTQIDKPIVSAYQEINVPYGARSKVLLPDGSHITLNAGTTLRYSNVFGKKSRDLWLDGEGYFVVSKSATPFVVHSGTVQIKALGTQFNVRAYSSENNIETTLVEGKVAISDANTQLGQAGEVTLLPNQKLIVSKNGKQEKTEAEQEAEQTEETMYADNTHGITAKPTVAVNDIVKQENVDPLPDISWKDNEWVIYRESLENLAIKLERRFDIKITFQDEQLKSLRYNGTLPDESLEQVLYAMSLVSPIKYSVKGKIVVFSENKQFKKLFKFYLF